MKMAVALHKCSCKSHARTHACSCSACPRGVMSSSHCASKATLPSTTQPLPRESTPRSTSEPRLLVSRKSCPRLKTKSVTQTSMRLAPGVSSSNSWRPCSPRALLTLRTPLSPSRSPPLAGREPSHPRSRLHAQLHQWIRCMKSAVACAVASVEQVHQASSCVQLAAV